jgi:hypothetical protein
LNCGPSGCKASTLPLHHRVTAWRQCLERRLMIKRNNVKVLMVFSCLS